MYTVDGSLKPSIHIRSSPETIALRGCGIGNVFAAIDETLKVFPRSVEWAAVISTNERLTKATFGMLELVESGPFTAMSASPPPGATPRLVRLPTLLAQPLVRIPQLSGWPSYLNGRVPLELGPPSKMGPKDWSQRHTSAPPGTPRMEST